jgi:hypothetical protein
LLRTKSRRVVRAAVASIGTEAIRPERVNHGVIHQFDAVAIEREIDIVETDDRVRPETSLILPD